MLSSLVAAANKFVLSGSFATNFPFPSLFLRIFQPVEATLCRFQFRAILFVSPLSAWIGSAHAQLDGIVQCSTNWRVGGEHKMD